MDDDKTEGEDLDSTRADDGLPPTKTARPGGTSRPGLIPIPESVGQYRILGKLGEGGMGVVYEAQQEHPKRKVAIKVVRGGQFVDEHHVRMFQREADTLARLKHSNIGGIYESGRTEDGQHFFAMELVRGDTLDGYLKKRSTNLTPQELRLRLALFRKIADAVHYAHQRGVIHRDLKPSNIVVTEEATSEDGRSTISGLRLPEIKILDFGLARITAGDVAAATLTTEVGVIKGTLPYMSPEQARGNPDEIDVRADVYALGVILYEMLTGCRPYDVLKKSLAEAVRVICEEPPRPLGRTWSGVRKLDPDIETIVGKALEKEADRRYASAAALSDDVSRYLTSQPILARPPSTMYQLRKFAWRNKVLVGGVVAVLMALAVGTVVSTWQAIRARRAEVEARKDAETSRQVSDFLVELFEVSDPGEARGNTITAREILDRGAKEIHESLADQPEVQARLMHTMGRVYSNLGLYGQSASLFREVIELSTSTQGRTDPDTLKAMNNLAIVLNKQGTHDEAERLYRAVLEGQRELLGDDHRDTLNTQNNLALLLHNQHKLDEAAELMRGTLEAQRRTLGAGDLQVARSMMNLAFILAAKEELDEAEPLLSEAIDLLDSIVGPDSPVALTARNNYAGLLVDRGKLAEAETVRRELLDVQTRVLGERHPNTLTSLNNLAYLLKRQKKLEDAEQLYRKVVELSLEVKGAAHPHTLLSMLTLGIVQRDRGNLTESHQTLSRAIRLLRENDVQDEMARGLLEKHYGRTLVALGRYEEAEPYLQRSLDTLTLVLGASHRRTQSTLEALVELYESWGKPDRAAEWRAKLPDTE